MKGGPPTSIVRLFLTQLYTLLYMRELVIKRRKKSGFDIDIDWEERLETIASEDKLNMFSALNAIVILSERSKLSQLFWQYAEPYIEYVSKKQKISKIQSILLAIITEGCADNQKVPTSDIASSLDCSNLTIMKYQQELIDLMKRGFIYFCNRFHPLGYSITPQAMDAFVKDKTFKRQSMAGADGVKLFKYFYTITHRVFEEELSHELMLWEIEQLFKENPSHPYVMAMRKLGLSLQDEIILTQFCRHLVFDGHSNLPAQNYLFLYEDYEKFNGCFGETLANKSPNLISMRLIEPACLDGLKDDETFTLTKLGREELLKEFKIKDSYNHNMFIIENENIKSKLLFFNESTNRQYHELTDLLSEKHFQEILQRLSDKGMRCGFTCLFYGSPGTGKTEMALQLARLTGRDIMQVNISQLKSKWVGESEKNIKSLFDRYKAWVNNSQNTPILLFNEADAIINKRLTNIDHAADKMENSIQNIILQEMENLNGIMIATTNLEQNFDSAFERRFLYKVRFEKPDALQRQSIWHSMLPQVDTQLIEQLAIKYDFSGGQIENISRKLEIDNILYGNEQSVLKLEQFCQDEVLSRRNTRPIGFLNN